MPIKGKCSSCENQGIPLTNDDFFSKGLVYFIHNHLDFKLDIWFSEGTVTPDAKPDVPKQIAADENTEDDDILAKLTLVILTLYFFCSFFPLITVSVS